MKFLSFILLLLSIVSAQDLSPTEVLKKIQSRYSGMNDASASFTQTVNLRFKKNGQQNVGTVKIKKGNKYRLETNQQTIVTDGKTVWMYTPATKQVLKDTFKQNRQPFSPDKFLLGLPKEFSATHVEKDSQYVVLSLQPTKTGSTTSLILALKVWVNPETWIFEKIEITDKNSTTTTISLSSIVFNKGIAEKDFQFEISGDMNIVDLTKLQ
ncbi:MAG: outer membrane lipoprotein carrier protein LolA [Bacteroidota bacterium]